MEIMKRLVQEEEGQGLVEYSLIIGLISIAIIAFGDDIATAIGEIFGSIQESLEGAVD